MKEWHRTYIDDWVAKDMLSKESILERFNKRIENMAPFSREGKSAIKRVFQSLCSTDGLLSESAFISALQTKSTLPQSPEGIQAGKIIYNSLAYLGTYPFPSSPKKNTTKRGLSLEQLARSLVWALPECECAVMEQSRDCRIRTKSDHRRLIFQSLASTTHTIPYDYEDARRMAVADAFEVDRENSLEYCSSNLDDDGDEIYHDILDVLHSTQEEKSPCLATVPRDSFRSVAKRIVIENNVPTLHPSAIPTDQFVSLIKLPLAFQLAPAETEVDLNHFNAAANSIGAAFAAHEEPEIITWSRFNHAFKEITPYLFDPLYNMLEVAFLESETFPLTGCDQPSTFGDILTLPLMSQLSTFLVGCIYLGDFRRLQHYTVSSRPTPTAFIEGVEKAPEEAVIILSGVAKSGHLHTFGVFSPKPKADGASIQTNFFENQIGLEPCSIFQLAPVQDVFRGAIGKPGWTVDRDTIAFGQGSGIVITLKDGLRRAEIKHCVSDTPSDEVYSTNKSRGSWMVNLEISEIEIWSEVNE